MNVKKILCFTLSILALSACKSEPPSVSRVVNAEASMKNIQLTARLQEKRSLQQLPSASGIELVGNSYYVVGDDSPFLYQLDAQYNLVKQHSLFDTKEFESGRIPKALKPDLESMAHFTYGRKDMLLILGSGASPARNRGFLVNITKEVEVQEVDFSRFYTFLKKVLGLAADGELNLEGLAIDQTYTYLMQRALGSGTNVLFRFDTDDFKSFLMNNGDIPAAAVYHFALPKIDAFVAGFSGAYALNDRLFFTASVESAPNAIEDGEVIGSIVGMIDLNALPYATNPANPLKVPTVQLMNEDGSVYKGKAESLIVKPGEGSNYNAVVVFDDDLGGSELVEVQLGVEDE